MALVQVRDVPDETVERLKAHAKARGLTMAAYIRAELEKLANRTPNSEVIDRILRERPSTSSTVEETVAIVRNLRDDHS